MTRFAPLSLLLVLFSSCEVVGGIFKAGFYTAIILGILLIVIIVWLLNRLKR